MDGTPCSQRRDALLYVQLQEGLRYELMKAPGVSGALDYQALCVAVRRRDWQRYRGGDSTNHLLRRFKRNTLSSGVNPKSDNSRTTVDGKKNCGQGGHMSFNCPKSLWESQGENKTKARMVDH